MADINIIIYSFAAGVWFTIGVYHLGRWCGRCKEARRG